LWKPPLAVCLGYVYARVVVLWHRTGFIRRLSPDTLGGASATILLHVRVRHLTRLGKTTFRTINIATAPRYTHAIRQPMPTINDGGATVSLIYRKGDSNRRGCSLKVCPDTFISVRLSIFPVAHDGGKLKSRTYARVALRELFSDDISTLSLLSLERFSFYLVELFPSFLFLQLYKKDKRKRSVYNFYP